MWSGLHYPESVSVVGGYASLMVCEEGEGLVKYVGKHVACRQVHDTCQEVHDRHMSTSDMTQVHVFRKHSMLQKNTNFTGQNSKTG